MADPGFLNGGRMERRGTNGRIATAHGHRPCWLLPPSCLERGRLSPISPKAATAISYDNLRIYALKLSTVSDLS